VTLVAFTYYQPKFLFSQPNFRLRGLVERLPGSGRHRLVRTESNIELDDLVCSQEGQPGTSKS